jgi:hypothetical protein
MITETQLQKSFRDIIEEQISIYNHDRSITVRNKIPDTGLIPIMNPQHWLQIPAVGCHLGIDQETALVRKLGLKQYADRTDRQNEVWAGKPVNMAAKLASISEDDELLVSERFFKNIQHELVIKSCGCKEGTYTGEKIDL